MNINGNIESLKKSVLEQLEELYDLEISKEELLPVQLAQRLAMLTYEIGREISVCIDRKGSIIDISVGDTTTVVLPQVEGRRSEARLSGIRCIHTHPNGSGLLSEIDLNSLMALRLDAMIALGVLNGRIIEVYAAVPAKDEKGIFAENDVYGPFNPGDQDLEDIFDYIRSVDRVSSGLLYDSESLEEAGILVGLETAAGRRIAGRTEGARSLEELEELAKTAGIKVLKKVLQKKPNKDTAYFVGKGLVEQLNLMRQELGADVLVFDDELSGAQVRNIENMTGIKVIDRTMLILDIFAQRARSKEGKLQVELAQLKYRLPRLIGLGTELSRLGGGIGTRGPGEKKLDVDRRHINRRVGYLEKELRELGRRRGLLREGRRKASTPIVALVGYTNAGKSTLLNRLCSADVFAENKLFATLDPTIRSFRLPDEREALMIDTVGFIRKLPHELVEAFKSTLEEAVYADVLLLVADASSEEVEEHIGVVTDLLNELGALDKPVILAYNKVDLTEGEFRIPASVKWGKSYEVSAVTGEGLDRLLQGIAEAIPAMEETVGLLVPYTDGWVMPYVRENGRVLEESYEEKGTRLSASVRKDRLEKIRKYIV